MRSERAWLRRSSIHQAKALLRTEGGRYVDYGLELVPVVKDEVAGTAVLPGKPGVWRAGESFYFGGVYDTILRKWCPERQSDPIVWYCSLEQLEVILHDREKTPEPYQLVYGAEGAGKTQVLAMGGLLKILGLVGITPTLLYVGLIAPVGHRLDIARRTIGEKVPIDTPTDRRDDSWGTYHAGENEIRFHFGITVLCRVAYQHSKAEGSPLQGITLAAALVDEDQDVVEMGVDADIEARLRGIKRTERLSTATAKDSPTWRRIRDTRLASGDWAIKRLPWYTNAFEWQERWDKFERNMSKRDRLRRMEAQDVGPELAVYYAWDHDRNIQPLPDLGIDVTSAIIHGIGYAPYQRSGARAVLIAAHDPGRIFQTTILLRAYWLKRMVVWYAIDEFITGPGREESEGESLTPRKHFKALKAYLQERYELNYDPDPDDHQTGSRRVIVLADPHDRGEKKPDEDTYHSAQAEGFDVFKAFEGTIKRRTRQDMVNALLEDSLGNVRLCAAVDDEGRQKCPTVVASFETLEKDAAGEGELNPKGIHDLTHPAVTVGYGLIPFEREVFSDTTRQLAKKEASK